MNPPSALHGAMGRERKPFTYTPGGLDLSEIKSERMARRLMRNAMNQGVPEVPVQAVTSPTTPSTPIAVPNFNCLPVQVFPTFALPANPKSLLRTRSTPGQSKDYTAELSSPLTSEAQQNNYYRDKSNDIATTNNINSKLDHNITNSALSNNPLHEFKINNDLFRENNQENLFCTIATNKDKFITDTINEFDKIEKVPLSTPLQQFSDNNTENNDKLVSLDIANFDEEQRKYNSNDKLQEQLHDYQNPFLDYNRETNDDNIYQKVVKKVKKEKKVEEAHNGENNAEAEVTVKIAPKKSAAKTETSVEVVKKVGADGQVEEVKTTTTKTTVDGRTEISTKTETRTLPAEKPQLKEVETEEVVEEEEEEEEEEEVEEEKVQEQKVVSKTKNVKENGHVDTVIKKEENSEVTTTKKVVVVQKQEPKEDEDQETEEVKVKTTSETKVVKTAQKEEVEEEEEEEEEDEEDEVVKVERKIEKEPEIVKEQKEPIKKDESIDKGQNGATSDNDDEEEEEEDEEEVVVKKEIQSETKQSKEEIIQKELEEEDDEEEEEEVVENKVELKQTEPAAKPEQEQDKVVNLPQPKKEESEEEEDDEEEEEEEEETVVKNQVKVEDTKREEVTPKPAIDEKSQKPDEKPEVIEQPKQQIPLLANPADSFEIKPILPSNESITRSHTENTEIITSQGTARPISTQTELHRVENILSINRTTKTLDHEYEQITQHGVPTVKTYFAPSRDRISISPSRPYQPTYQPEPQTERRHSLLLERLSMERQPPIESYQTYNQSYDSQNQYSQEPQSEVVNASNVKPSTITNQEWYQQSRKENVIYNNVLPELQPQPQQQPQPQAQQWSQPSYTDNFSQDYSKASSNLYQQSQPSGHMSYSPKPSTWGTNNLGQLNSVPTINQSNQYSYTKDSSESYQKSTEQYSSSYVPPPWEADNSYLSPQNTSQIYYQAPTPSANTFSPNATPSWNPNLASAKYTKPPPTSYQPPAPNQSFVRSAAPPPKIPGRKTYYSEYERRYISVPESTYVPTDTKYQAQPDASPQYYYDNNEPAEQVEPAWRKELREFTEKTQTQTETISTQPPWEAQPTYAKNPTVAYTPTPSWSQTLRPQSWRERSFESDYVGSQEWKTNTVGRGRPVSTYAKSNIETIPERPRGVSVDRYNPNSYQAPPQGEHPPPQVHMLSPTPPGKTNYHNPNVPAYHVARASAEPRESVVSQQQTRVWGNEARASPIQSRSFKYLQWITGTEE